MIGAGAGFAGDRIEPAVELARSGTVDAIALECLAERTLIAALRARQAAADGGYDARLRRRLTPLLAATGKRCRVRVEPRRRQSRGRRAGARVRSRSSSASPICASRR